MVDVELRLSISSWSEFGFKEENKNKNAYQHGKSRSHIIPSMATQDLHSIIVPYKFLC